MSTKKGGKSQKEHASYDIRDIVLAKVRGYPPWPGMVVDPDSVPSDVSKERPGKKSAFYCVRFFPAGDYAWLVSKDISKLQTHEIEAYISEPYRRSGDLLTGYRIALDPKKWEEEREQAGFEAGEAEANAEIDQLDSEGENGKAVKSKKRKREPESGVSSKGRVRNKPKKGSAEPSIKKKSGTAKVRKNGNKSKAVVESEDEGADAGDDDVGPSKKSSPPPTKKARREKDDDEFDAQMSKDPEAIKVRDWRHRLQKTFLGKGLPKEEDMATLDVIFTTVENYEQMNIQYLSFSKIGKVMRHIAALSVEKVPKDDDFKFRERAKVLVDKWHQILNANKPNGADANGSKIDGDLTAGTAAIDLNGNVDGSPTHKAEPADVAENAVPAAPPTANPVENDETLGDVTMSEA